MSWNELVREYFSFSRRERIAVLVIILLLGVSIFAPRLLRKTNSSGGNAASDSTWLATARELIQDKKPDSSYESTGEREMNPVLDRRVQARREKAHPFLFDPNQLDKNGWTKLGLEERTISAILNYRARGGHFSKPADLARIYTLSKTDFDRLEPFIRIAGKEAGKPEPERKYPGKNETAESSRPAAIDINMADTVAWKALPGIGSKLAARIINFREKLGGFYSVEQIGETYGLADSIFQRIKPYLVLENTGLKKININAATLDELKNHPYIRYRLAQSIIAYRKERGPFKQIGDIKLVMAIDEEVYAKISPYLAIE
jgi:competence ComEA-like helix-hairpin-helix protein